VISGGFWSESRSPNTGGLGYGQHVADVSNGDTAAMQFFQGDWNADATS
jgi:hypothetical protein